MISRWLSILGISALLLSACAPATPSATSASGRLRVVATFSVLGDLVSNVGGDAIELTVLVGPDSDTHTYEPSPSDSAALAEAQVLVENGLELESWLDELVTASGSQATRIVAAEGISARTAEHAEEHEGEEHEGEEHEGEEHEGEEGHEHGEFDPHIWQDVANAMQMVRNIEAGLSAADPDNAAVYQSNARAYLDTLEELDTYIRSQAGSLPEDRRRIVTNHNALGYFGAAYGFTLVADVLGTASTEAAEPSAQALAALADRIRNENVAGIFTENMVNTALADTLSRETGVAIGGALYTDALSAPGGKADTYVAMMRANIDTLVTALK